MTSQFVTWINGPSDDTAQWVPGTVVKPVVEVVETLLCQETGGAVVEVGIELVDHTLEAQHREQTC